MFPIKDGLHRPVGPVSVIFLLLTHFCGGWSQEMGPPQPVMAMVGDDVVLPCQLEPPLDAVSMTLEWGRPDLEPRFVHVWHDGQELLADQNEAYKGRTSLFITKLKRGDISLALSTVKVSDNGRYRCYFPKLKKEYFVELLVAAVSSPAISLAGLHKATSGVVLHCGSAGWYPEPEVLWLDAEGNLLPAGPPETSRGPDDLYTVSSTVTVEKRPSSSFTCRVHQKTSNQTRETHITVPGDFFMAPSSCTASSAFSILFGFMFVLTLVYLVWKWRQNKTRCKGTTTQQPLMEADRTEQLITERQNKEEELRKKEEEQEEVMKVIKTLTEVNEDLMKQKEEITVHRKEVEKQEEENEKKVKLLEADGAENKGQKQKELKERSWVVEERKKELQQLHMWADKLLQIRMDDFKRFTEKKKNGEKLIEQMKKQLEEIQRKPEDGGHEIIVTSERP